MQKLKHVKNVLTLVQNCLEKSMVFLCICITSLTLDVHVNQFTARSGDISLHQIKLGGTMSNN